MPDEKPDDFFERHTGVENVIYKENFLPIISFFMANAPATLSRECRKEWVK